MKAHEFLATVKDRGEYSDQSEARQVTAVVRNTLCERLAGGESHDLAAQLPAGIGELVSGGDDASAASFGVEQFLSRIAAGLDASPETAKWDASAVLSTQWPTQSPVSSTRF